MNKSRNSYQVQPIVMSKKRDVLIINYDDGYKGIYSTKQCMYSLKQSHGAVRKKMLFICFLRESLVVCCRFANMKNDMLFWYM